MNDIVTPNITVPLLNYRNYEFRNSFMLAEKVEAKLIDQLGSSDFNKFLPCQKNIFGQLETSRNFLIDTNFVVGNDNFLQISDKNFFTDELISTTPVTRLYKLLSSHPLTRVIGEHQKITDDEVTETLVRELKLSDGICSIPDFGRWKLSPFCHQIRDYFPNRPIFDFRDRDGIFNFSLVSGMFRGIPIYAPFTSWVYPDNMYSRPLSILPKERLCFFNEDLLAQYPKAQVYLTDSVEFAAYNQYFCNPNDSVFIAWFGEHETLSAHRLDLLGSHVNFVISLDTSLRTVFEVFDQLTNLRGIDFPLVDCRWNDTDIYQCRQTPRQTCIESIIKEAETSRQYVPDSIYNRGRGLRVKSNRGNYPERPYLIFPFFKIGYLIVIFAISGAGKSLFCNALGQALSFGKAPLKGWDVDSVHKVQYYDAELLDDEADARSDMLEELYYSEGCERDNFVYKNVRGKSLFDEVFQKEIFLDLEFSRKHLGTKGLKVDTIVLDNLTFLAPGSDHKAKLMELMPFIERLKSYPLGIILIHHTEKTGEEMIGTSQLNNSIDFSIQLKPIPSTRALTLSVVFGKKKRYLPPGIKESFITLLDTKKNLWRVLSAGVSDIAWKSLSDEEKITEIQSCEEQKFTIADIAAKWDVGTDTVNKTKKKLGLVKNKKANKAIAVSP